MRINCATKFFDGFSPVPPSPVILYLLAVDRLTLFLLPHYKCIKMISKYHIQVYGDLFSLMCVVRMYWLATLKVDARLRRWSAREFCAPYFFCTLHTLTFLSPYVAWTVRTGHIGGAYSGCFLFLLYWGTRVLTSGLLAYPGVVTLVARAHARNFLPLALLLNPALKVVVVLITTASEWSPFPKSNCGSRP